MLIVWDKTSSVDGFSAEYYLETFENLKNEQIVFLKIVDGEVTGFEGKNALARIYNLDPALTNDEFIAAYEAKLAELEEQARLEAPDEPFDEEEPTEPEPEPDETATYAELAQVYKEGVNGLE